MYGIVRPRLVTFISKNHIPLPFFNRINNRKLITTTTSSTSPGTAAAQQLPNCSPPFPPTISTGSIWKDNLKIHSLKYWILGSLGACLVGSTSAILTYNYLVDRAKAQEKPVSVKKLSSFEEMVANTKVAFPFDEKDLVDDKSIRKLYERWLIQYGVTRDNPDDKEEHYQAFKHTAYDIYFFNKTHTDSLSALNHFGDMTDKEWADMHPPIQLPSDSVIAAALANGGRITLESLNQEEEEARKTKEVHPPVSPLDGQT